MQRPFCTFWAADTVEVFRLRAAYRMGLGRGVGPTLPDLWVQTGVFA